MVSGGQLEALLAGFDRARIGVLGDYCLDVYWLLDMAAAELSLETGKRTHPVARQRYALGGAGNVVANLHALGTGTIAAYGVVGADPFGERMLALLRERAVRCEAMLQCADEAAWQTLAYCKPFVGDQELSRIDMGNFNQLPDTMAGELLDRLEADLPGLDVVIVNQQVLSGLHTAAFREQLQALMQRHPDTRFLYDGRHHADAYPHAWLKINAHEALRLTGTARAPDDPVLREEALGAAAALHERLGTPLFVTRGSRGCIVHDASGSTEAPGLQQIGPTDPVGAGDAFLAALCAALATGAGVAAAAAVGNLAAAVTVAKLRQTGTATPAEILDIGRAPHYVHEPDLAEHSRRACYWQATQIEIVRDPPRELRITCAIFDHDGTISTLRQGWEQVMEPMMVEAVLGGPPDQADEGLVHRVVDRVRGYIDQTTGIQTLAQMQGLVDLVREYGLVPEDAIRDMHGYKAVYNDALMARVGARVDRLQRGELGVEDCTMKNAVALLGALHAAGVKLYLASGTDQADVEAEAAALGYDHLFEGRIHGSVGDVTRDAKRIVLERIMNEIGSLQGRVATFGDGPVEIRETHERGGFGIGVASDEIQRFDLNPVKRTRLIRAGASVVIPDFAQMAELLRFLRIQPRT